MFMCVSCDPKVASGGRQAAMSQMWGYGRGNSGGSWLPEEKKIIFGPEEEIVVAHCRPPSPAP